MELKAGSAIRSFDQEGLITKEPAMRKLVDLFCHVDDFCQAFHMSHQRYFKNFYFGIIHRYYKKHFPALLSHTRFLEVIRRYVRHQISKT